MARFVFAMAAFAGIGALIAFATLLGVQVSAQQQTTPAENHHPNSSSNQSGISSTVEQRQNTTTVGGGIMIKQTFATTRMSLVDGVKVNGISIIDNEHIAINLRYDGKGESPGVSVVAITNSTSDTIIGSMMQNSTPAMNGNNDNDASAKTKRNSGSDA